MKPIVFSQRGHQAHSIHSTDIRTNQQHASPPRTKPFDTKQNGNLLISAAKSSQFLTPPIPQHHQNYAVYPHPHSLLHHQKLSRRTLPLNPGPFRPPQYIPHPHSPEILILPSSPCPDQHPPTTPDARSRHPTR